MRPCADPAACLPLVPPAIYLELERMGFKVWYDNRADDLTKEGMLKGIEQAAAFMLFLSEGVLQRPYCQMEIRHALALQKPVVLLHGERGGWMPGARALRDRRHRLA